MLESKSNEIRTGLESSYAAIAQAVATSVEREILPPYEPPNRRVSTFTLKIWMIKHVAYYEKMSGKDLNATLTGPYGVSGNGRQRFARHLDLESNNKYSCHLRLECTRQPGSPYKSDTEYRFQIHLRSPFQTKRNLLYRRKSKR